MFFNITSGSASQIELFYRPRLTRFINNRQTASENQDFGNLHSVILDLSEPKSWSELSALSVQSLYFNYTINILKLDCKWLGFRRYVLYNTQETCIRQWIQYTSLKFCTINCHKVLINLNKKASYNIWKEVISLQKLRLQHFN